jgi:hypothetical protein
MNRIRTLTGLSAGMSLAVAAVAFAAPDREFSPSAAMPTLQWDSAPMTAGVLGVDSDRDNTLVKLPAGGNVAIKLTDFSEPSGAGADFDIRLYAANAEGDPEGEALGEAINTDAEQESLTVKNLKPGNYNVEVNAFATVEGTFHGNITASGAATAGSAPAPSGGGEGGTPSGPAPAPTAAPAPATDATPDAKLGKVAKKPRSFKGTATDDKGVAKVEVALQLKKGKKCSQMTAKGKFVKLAKCDAPTSWLLAKGTAKWSYKLKKKLKKGGYTVFARATDTAGQVQAGFTPANKRAFKVK